jgi:hypothetical protein
LSTFGFFSSGGLHRQWQAAVREHVCWVMAWYFPCAMQTHLISFGLSSFFTSANLRAFIFFPLPILLLLPVEKSLAFAPPLKQEQSLHSKMAAITIH